jgi:transposase
VGAIVARVWADVQVGVDPLDGLRRIGIDEISYKRGRKFLTVVVDHDTGRLVWAAPGRDRATLRAFFDALGPERSAALTHISADAADWVAEVVADRAPGAVQCADAFHVIKWASAALDEVRIAAWREARAGGAFRRKGRGRRDSTGTARAYRHARYALWKNPDNLTDRQRDKLTWITKTDPRLHRAYLLKEALRWVFAVKGETGKQALHRWISWARRCRLPAFIALQRRITRHRREIEATLEHGLSNALIESVNTKIRLISRVAFGFRSPDALIALAMLNLGGHRPTMPGRR